MRVTHIPLLLLPLSVVLGCGQRQSADSPVTNGADIATAPEATPARATPNADQRDAIQEIVAAGGSVDCDADGWPTLIDLASDRASANDEIVRCVLRFPGLTRLRLAVNSVSPETLSELKTLAAMEELLLQDVTLDDQQMAALLQSMPALRRLTLRRLSNVTDQGLAAIPECPQLEVLALIEMSQISGATLAKLALVPNLRSLDLRNCGQLALADFEQLPSLSDLSEVKLGGPAVTDDVLKIVAGLPSLASLTIEDAQISGPGLGQLAQAPGVASRLRSLSIARCFGVTDDTLQTVGSLSALESLSLRDIMLTGSFLNSLETSLDEAVPWRTLVVTDAFLTDDALAALPKLAPHLQRLDLRGNQGVSDQSLDVLRQLPELADVDLEGTGVSDPAALEK